MANITKEDAMKVSRTISEAFKEAKDFQKTMVLEIRPDAELRVFTKESYYKLFQKEYKKLKDIERGKYL